MKDKLVLILVLLSVFLIVGCSNTKKDLENKNIETEKDIYIKNVKKLEKVEKSTDNLPFSIEVKYEKMDDEVRYQVIIDNPKQDITNIKALAIHNKQTDDVFPSVGIFDKKVNLIPNKKPSGVILVGYFPYKGDMDNLNVEMKVLISYTMDNKKITSYYLTKK